MGKEAKRLLAQFPDRIGHIYAPGGFKTPWPHYALDNGAYADYSKGKPFSADKFRKLCASAKAADHPPRWVAVPDVVTDRDATLERYHEWFAELQAFGWPLAFVAQDGMTANDVPGSASVVFVGGGSTEWKQQTAAYWCQHFPRVHVGRVNGEKDLWRYHRVGAESCDGTGWFRGRRKQLDGLWYYLTDTEGLETDPAHGPMQGRLFAGAPQ